MITLKKIYSFIQGWTRYYMYYGEYRNEQDIRKNCGIKIPIGELGKDYQKEDIEHYYNGNLFLSKIRYKWNKLVYNLLPSHIKQQIQIRIWSSIPCIEIGQCKICKCSTPALQMADKACEKPCYPAMLSKKDWEEFYGDGEHTPIKWHLDVTTNLEWTIFDNKFVNKQDYISKKFLNNNHE